MLLQSSHTTILVLFSIGIIMASNQQKVTAKMIEGNIQFSLDVYRQLVTKGGNIFFSPFSLSTVMSMLFMGARNKTALEMEQVMKIESTKYDLHSVFEECIRLLMHSSEEYTLSVANRLYAQQGGPILEEYSSGCKKYYHAGIEEVDFQTEALKIQKIINTWVSDQTQGKIQNLIPDGALTPLTVLVIVNAIYFKGDWKSQFNPTGTRPIPFHVTKSETVSVEMMYKKQKFKFGMIKNLKCKVLELPYKGDHLRMIVVLPDEVDGLSAVEEKLTPSLLLSFPRDHMQETNVEVNLPKFKFETGLELREIFMAMGMKDLFNDADLSGINGATDLYVSNVFHKAFIEVNEEGTVAAAATAAVVNRRSISITPQVMANHPFLFYIMDSRTDAILFLGRFIKPTGLQEDASRVQQKVEL